jgi:hypothetical protein
MPVEEGECGLRLLLAVLAALEGRRECLGEVLAGGEEVVVMFLQRSKKLV